MVEPSKQQMVMESMREYLKFLAMETYHDAIESGDYNHYRDDPNLELHDLYSDLWDDRKYMLAKAFFSILEPYRQAVCEWVREAAPLFDQMIADEETMKKIFAMSRAEKRSVQRIFDGEKWIQFGEFDGYSQEIKARAKKEFNW